MAQKDYVRRNKSASSRQKKGARHQAKKAPVLMILFAVVLIVAFIAGLAFLVQHKKSAQLTPPAKALHNSLPPKPEERWRYRKELENRNPGVAAPSKPVPDGNINKRQLTDEQRQLLEQIEADKRHPPTQLNEVPWNGQPSITHHDNAIAPEVSAPSPVSTMNSASKPPAPAAKNPPPAAPDNTATRWMVQCGSFKNTDQAEAVRAQLAFEGFESRISASDGWQRVVLGPYLNKNKVDSVLARLNASGHSNCIRLNVGG